MCVHFALLCRVFGAARLVKLACSRVHWKGVCEDTGSVSCSSSGHLKRDSLVCVCVCKES